MKPRIVTVESSVTHFSLFTHRAAKIGTSLPHPPQLTSLT